MSVIPLPRGTIDETGHTYGRLRVLEYAGLKGGKAAWLCLCDPALEGDGTRLAVRGDYLRTGRAVSCGCFRADPAVRQAAILKVSKRRRVRNTSKAGNARWARAKD